MTPLACLKPALGRLPKHLSGPRPEPRPPDRRTHALRPLGRWPHGRQGRRGLPAPWRRRRCPAFARFLALPVPEIVNPGRFYGSAQPGPELSRSPMQSDRESPRECGLVADAFLDAVRYVLAQGAIRIELRGFRHPSRCGTARPARAATPGREKRLTFHPAMCRSSNLRGTSAAGWTEALRVCGWKQPWRPSASQVWPPGP